MENVKARSTGCADNRNFSSVNSRKFDTRQLVSIRYRETRLIEDEDQETNEEESEVTYCDEEVDTVRKDGKVYKKYKRTYYDKEGNEITSVEYVSSDGESNWVCPESFNEEAQDGGLANCTLGTYESVFLGFNSIGSDCQNPNYFNAVMGFNPQGLVIDKIIGNLNNYFNSLIKNSLDISNTVKIARDIRSFNK